MLGIAPESPASGARFVGRFVDKSFAFHTRSLIVNNNTCSKVFYFAGGGNRLRAVFFHIHKLSNLV